MDISNGVVETIAEGGFGDEAIIKVQLRTSFPGLGGTFVTREGVAAALRIEKNPQPLSGHMMFMRHLVIKKFDDHFYRSGVYMFSHVPRALGSISKTKDKIEEAYIYEWAFGTDGFSWKAAGCDEDITLHDWGKFVDNFWSAGIDLQYDTCDATDGRVSKNIVHQYASCTADDEMCSLWKRIDYGFRSIRVDKDRLLQYLDNRKHQLVITLKADRYEMLCLAVKYIIDRDRMKEYDLGRLERFIGEYRRSSLRHYVYGFGPAGADVRFIEETESLFRAPQ